jgi:hypothetical protein
MARMNTDIIIVAATGVALMSGTTATAIRAIKQAKREAASRYPHPDGDFTVLGPEIFTDKTGDVISWKGENYARQTQEGQAE